MRYIVILLVLYLGCVARVSGQIQVLAGEVVENRFLGDILYAVKDETGTAPFGMIRFTPEEGGHGWIFEWTYNGNPQPVVYNTDSTFLEVDIPGKGYYTFRAEREGHISQSAPAFHIFFDHVPEFDIRLTDIYNCTAISIGEITSFDIQDYEYNGVSYNETSGYQRKVKYLLPGKTVPISFENYEDAFQPKENAVAVSSEDMDVSVTITDLFGIAWISKAARYTSVIPEADWEIEYGNTIDVEGQVHEETGQAPLEVMFRNNSVNAQEYKWYLYKDTLEISEMAITLEDSLLDRRIRTEKEFTYTYEHPGKYKVQMVAINSTGNRCQDTIEAQYVNVVASFIDVPNVFTPNGDGINDIFKPKCLSLESFEGVIINRWGRKLYEWRDPEGGWDGRIHGKYASPGTYYYIITARGREKSNPPRYVRKGALLLVR